MCTSLILLLVGSTPWYAIVVASNFCETTVLPIWFKLVLMAQLCNKYLPMTSISNNWISHYLGFVQSSRSHRS